MDQSSRTTKVLLETPYRADNLPPEYEVVLTALRKAVGHGGRLARPAAAANLIVSFLPEYGNRSGHALQVVNFLRNENILVPEEGDALIFFDPLRVAQVAAAEAYLHKQKPTFGEPPCRTFHELVALVGMALTVDENTARLVVASLTSKRFLIPDPVDASLAWVDEQPTPVPDVPTETSETMSAAALPAPPSPTPAPDTRTGRQRRIVQRFTVRVPDGKPKRAKSAARKPAGQYDDELRRLEDFIANRTRFLRVFSNLHRRARSLERRLKKTLAHTQKRVQGLQEKCDRVTRELREARHLLAKFRAYARSAR